MQRITKIFLILLSILIIATIGFFIWLVLPLYRCANHNDKSLFYHNGMIGFMYPSSLCVLEDYEYRILELSKSRLPNNFYYRKGYETESWREFFRIALRLSSPTKISEEKISFLFISLPNENISPSEYLRRLNKNNFLASRNAKGTEYIRRTIIPSDKNAVPYTEVAMFSTELKKIVFLTLGPRISEEEFDEVIGSFKFEK